MKQVAMVQPNGEVAHVFSPGKDSDYLDGETYGDQVARDISAELDPGGFARGNVWRDGGWQEKPARPSAQHVWNGSSWDVDAEALLKAIRAERNRRLAQTDHMFLTDRPTPAAEWVAYRQALRDVPETAVGITSIAEVDWPLPPS